MAKKRKGWFPFLFRSEKKQGRVGSQSKVTRAVDSSGMAKVPMPPRRDAAAIRVEEEKVPTEWNVGDVILDLYEVKRIHSGGAMGLVYRVHHRNWNMDLAVKSPRKKYLKTKAHKDNFVRECETWINLGLHPNTVSCYYVRTLGGIPRVFAEYIEGGSLKDWIDNKKLYEGGSEKALERILDIAIQFAWGLHYAHEHGVIHQDVKPANVMISLEGTAKVTDFGLAKARAATAEEVAAGSQRSILVNAAGMTPAYCSPEQANKKKLGRKTDIWSWGLSVLEMFAGGIFWRLGPAALDALKSYLEMVAEKEPITKMPNVLAELLEWCFQWRPADRPKNLLEIAARIKGIYQDSTGEAYPREEPKAAELLADSMNNRAISLLDLGRTEEAEELYNKALLADPHHPETTYNRGLLLWHSAQTTPERFVTQLEETRTTHPEDWQVEYLLGLVHIERGDAESAVKHLEKAARQAGDDSSVQKALQTARKGIGKWGYCEWVFKGHKGGVNSVALSPDGRSALSGSDDRTLRLWDVSTGEPLRTFEGQMDEVMCVTFSPDGRLALSGTRDARVRLWEVQTGKYRRTFKGHREDVYSVAFSPDGRFALSGSRDKTLRLWDVRTGKWLWTFKEHTDSVKSVAFSPDGRLALSASQDMTLRLWDVLNRKYVDTFMRGSTPVLCVAFSPDGRLALSGSGDGRLRLWNVQAGTCFRVFEGYDEPVHSVAFSPDGCLALSGAGGMIPLGEKRLRLWEVRSGRYLRAFEGHRGPVTSVAFSSDGRFGLSGSDDWTLRLWRIPRCEDQKLVLCRPRSPVELAGKDSRALRLKSQAELELASGNASTAYAAIQDAMRVPGYTKSEDLLDLRRRAGARGRTCHFSEGWQCKIYRATDWVFSVSISPDARFALSGGWPHALKLWDLKTGEWLSTFPELESGANSVPFSPDGRFALSPSWDRSLRLWEVETGQCRREFEGHKDRVWSVKFSPDGRFALSASWDRSLRLWEVETGQCLQVLGADTNFESVAFSPDGRFALSGSVDKKIRLWELESGDCLRVFEEHAHDLNSVAFSPDGRLALSGNGPTSKDGEGTVCLWEVASGRCQRIFKGHTGGVGSAEFSPDGRFVLSGSNDNTVRIWEVETGRCVRIFEGHEDHVKSVVFSMDCRYALSGSVDCTLRLWELVWDYEFPKPADWDHGARAYLEIFLTLHCPYGEDGISRVGKPEWNEDDFQKLLKDLQYRGYGWLRPEGVRKKLGEMTANWQGPPPLPGQ